MHKEFVFELELEIGNSSTAPIEALDISLGENIYGLVLERSKMRMRFNRPICNGSFEYCTLGIYVLGVASPFSPYIYMHYFSVSTVLGIYVLGVASPFSPYIYMHAYICMRSNKTNISLGVSQVPPHHESVVSQ